MQYRHLGRCGLSVSPLSLGTMMFGGPADEAESVRIIGAALDAGINVLDTADIYNDGRSEQIVGRAIASCRDDVVLATKGRQPTGQGPNDRGAGRVHLVRALERSLKRLGTDYVDLYYVHAPDPHTPIDETLRALDDMVRSGKVRYIGCSNFRAWQVCQALWTSDRLGLNHFVCVQPLYNIVNRDIEVELLPLCSAYGLGVISYSPLARGVLTGKYRLNEAFPPGSRADRKDKRLHEVELRQASLEIAERLGEYCRRRGVSLAQFALAWCLANPLVTSIILGPRTPQQLADNLACLEVTVTAEDEAFVDSLVPPGEHSGKGFPDPAYPITGRPVATGGS